MPPYYGNHYHHQWQHTPHVKFPEEQNPTTIYQEQETIITKINQIITEFISTTVATPTIGQTFIETDVQVTNFPGYNDAINAMGVPSEPTVDLNVNGDGDSSGVNLIANATASAIGGGMFDNATAAMDGGDSLGGGGDSLGGGGVSLGNTVTELLRPVTEEIAKAFTDPITLPEDDGEESKVSVFDHITSTVRSLVHGNHHVSHVDHPGNHSYHHIDEQKDEGSSPYVALIVVLAILVVLATVALVLYIRHKRLTAEGCKDGTGISVVGKSFSPQRLGDNKRGSSVQEQPTNYGGCDDLQLPKQSEQKSTGKK